MGEYPKRVRVKRMTFDHWDRERGYSHATGWEVWLGEKPSDRWLEFEDPRTGETFLAR